MEESNIAVGAAQICYFMDAHPALIPHTSGGFSLL